MAAVQARMTTCRALAALAILVTAGCGSNDAGVAQAPASSSTTETCGTPPVLPESAMDPDTPLHRANADDYEGMTLAEAEALAAQRGEVVQHIGADGTCFPGPFPANVRSDRVNVYTEDRVVQDAYTG